MSRYSLNEFVSKSTQQDLNQGVFELENPHTLEINLAGRIWTKMGAMIAYLGQINFTREGVFEHGIASFFKKAFTGEGMALMKAEGAGKLYVADRGKRIHILQLNNESICVNGNDVLAFEPTLKWDIKMIKRLAGMLAGGLFNVTFQGTGLIAITSHYQPLTLRVTPQLPVTTDPNATIAWSGNLAPEIVTNFTLRTLIGRGSGETIQMRFSGNGWVVVQPYEEVYFQGRAGG